MATVLTGQIQVTAPPGEVYASWVDVESLPDYLEMVQSIRRVDEIRSFWEVRIGRGAQTFYADIVDAVPGRSVSWQSTDGIVHSGRVDIEDLGGTTRVALRMVWDEQDPFAGIGLPVEIDQDVAQRDLQRFKRRIEARTRSGIAR